MHTRGAGRVAASPHRSQCHRACRTVSSRTSAGLSPIPQAWLCRRRRAARASARPWCGLGCATGCSAAPALRKARRRPANNPVTAGAPPESLSTNSGSSPQAELRRSPLRECELPAHASLAAQAWHNALRLPVHVATLCGRRVLVKRRRARVIPGEVCVLPTFGMPLKGSSDRPWTASRCSARRTRPAFPFLLCHPLTRPALDRARPPFACAPTSRRIPCPLPSGESCVSC